MTFLIFFLLLLVVNGVLAMPPPFHRVLRTGLFGLDVLIMQKLLQRAVPSLAAADGIFGPRTHAALQTMQHTLNLTVDGILGPASAAALLRHFSADQYVDPLRFPLPAPYKYKVHVPVKCDRSIVLNATLYDAQGNVLLVFPAKAHGHNENGDPRTPLNQFSTNGATPTGLIEFDLNSREPNATVYGPYPVNRAVKGLRGNAEFCLTNDDKTVRRGILLHTGAWGVDPRAPMPNSEGCIHAHANAIAFIAKTLTAQLGVAIHQNPFGQIPYPYQPQGLLSVVQVDQCH